MAGLHYHYGVGTANEQQYVLGNLLVRYLYKSVYRLAVEGVGYIIKNLMRGEVFRFLVNGFTMLRIRKYVKSSTADNIKGDLTHDERTERCLMEWKESDNPLCYKSGLLFHYIEWLLTYSRSMSPILGMLQGLIEVERIYLNDYAHKMFETIIQMDVKAQSEFSTKSMTWFNSIRNLIRNQLGYNETSVMSGPSWEYAISEAMKSSGMEIVPGISRGRPSYAHLYHIQFQTVEREISSRTGGRSESVISHECLSFTLPLHKIPDGFQKYLQMFLSRNPDVGRSPENAMKFRRRQNLVK